MSIHYPSSTFILDYNGILAKFNIPILKSFFMVNDSLILERQSTGGEHVCGTEPSMAVKWRNPFTEIGLRK